MLTKTLILNFITVGGYVLTASASADPLPLQFMALKDLLGTEKFHSDSILAQVGIDFEIQDPP
jgi:hypothetical protein